MQKHLNNVIHGIRTSWVVQAYIVALGLSLCASTIHAQTYTQLGLDIVGKGFNDESGWSVSVSADGTVVAIGAPYHGYPGSLSGHVRMYHWTGTEWTQRGTDIYGEAAANFNGYSVSLSADGNAVAIGAPYNNVQGSRNQAGHTRVYDWNGADWVQRGVDIDGEASGDHSGWSVSLSADGNVVAIGAIDNDGNGTDAGQVRVFAWSGSMWIQRGFDIDGEAANDGFGRSVSLSSDGTVLVAGAAGNDGNGSAAGHARVYVWNGTSWSQRGSDIDGVATEDQFGYAVSISGDGNRVAIGARYNDGSASNAGHVRVFSWNSSSWTQLGADIEGEAANDNFGSSVALSTDGLVLAVGAPFNDGNGSDAGHVRIFKWNGTDWVKQASDIDGSAAGDQSGYAVALSSGGSVVAIGAIKNTSLKGHARLFRKNTVGYVNGPSGWRQMSSPVEATFADLFGSIWTQGFSGASTQSGSPSILLYDGNNFTALSELQSTIEKGKGYFINVYADDDYGQPGIQGGFPKTMDVSGVEHAAPFTVTGHSGAGKYTLLGNPFSTPISWDEVFAASEQISSTVYVYDPLYSASLDDGDTNQENTIGAYRAWNGSVGGLTNGLIAPFQGFWVQSTGDSPSITFTNTAKYSGTTFFRGKQNKDIQNLHLVVESEFHTNEAWIHFSEKGEVGFDAWDGWKLHPLSKEYLLLSTGDIDGYGLDINHLPQVYEKQEIPLNVHSSYGGMVKLRIEHTTIPGNWSIQVRDSLTGEVFDLQESDVTIHSTQLAKANVSKSGLFDKVSSTQSRYSLLISPNVETSIERLGVPSKVHLSQNYPNPFNPSTSISFDLPVAGEVSLTVHDMLGRTVATLVRGGMNAGTHTLTWDASRMASGMYMYRLQANGTSFTKKMMLVK